ncbi:hypothetical protein M9434_002839 [Picochlorum sp. BPE23]|nr:hypothetical protein M9434_002839 [Picochlorum sp. BPE23]
MGDRRQAAAQLPSGGAVATPQVHVTLEDQQNINTFSRLNSQLQEIRSKLTAKKRVVEDLEEAGNEAMLVDDDVVPFVVGECFVRLPQEDVESKIEELKGAAEAEVASCEREMETIVASMNDLKTQLYAKFGNTINLEE